MKFMPFVSPQAMQGRQSYWRLCTHPIKQSALRLAIAALLCMGLAFGVAQQAQAAGHTTAHTSRSNGEQQALTMEHLARAQRALVGCSGTNCNGANPYNTGCSADAYIVQIGPGGSGYQEYGRGDNGGVGDGYMNLMYSPTCGTNWSYVTNDFDGNPNPGINRIEAQVDNLSTDYYYWSSCYNCGSQASLMTYAPNSPAEADGWIEDPTWPNGLRILCLSQEGPGNCWTNLPH